MQISFKERTLSLEVPRIMGILNVTPDSFSDGGRHQDAAQAFDHAVKMLKDGADIIDIGGESTRPGAVPVSLEEELERVIPVVEKISSRLDVMISIDTSQPRVMEEAVKAGAHVWNDIRALAKEGAPQMAAKLGVPVILMHMQGEPRTMQDHPYYQDVTAEVLNFLQERTQSLIDSGLKSWQILWDAGFGFGKSTEDNYRLLSNLEQFTAAPYPFVAALSRKRMIGEATGVQDPAQRITGSVAAALICVQKGASIVRVHDVRETREALAVLKKIKEFS